MFLYILPIGLKFGFSSTQNELFLATSPHATRASTNFYKFIVFSHISLSMKFKFKTYQYRHVYHQDRLLRKRIKNTKVSFSPWAKNYQLSSWTFYVTQNSHEVRSLIRLSEIAWVLNTVSSLTLGNRWNRYFSTFWKAYTISLIAPRGVTN